MRAETEESRGGKWIGGGEGDGPEGLLHLSASSLRPSVGRVSEVSLICREGGMRRKEVGRPAAAGLRLFWPFKGDAFPQHNFLYVTASKNKLSQ